MLAPEWRFQVSFLSCTLEHFGVSKAPCSKNERDLELWTTVLSWQHGHIQLLAAGLSL